MDIYLNERCNKILKILLEQNEPITIEKITKELNVSNRTIRYDLEEIEALFKDYDDLKIQKKARVGIWVEGSEEKLNLVKELVYNNKSYIKPLSTEERKYYIIRQLIQAPDIIKMQNLANELYVSRVTIYNDLKGVEEWLEKFDLKLIRKQNYGLQIDGEEKNWRNAVSALLALVKSNEELKFMLAEANEFHYEGRLNYKNFVKLRELVPEIDFKVIEIILDEAEGIFNLSLTDEAFEGLIVHIAISMRRISSNKDVELNKEQLAVVKETKEYGIGQWIAARLRTEFFIELPESEVAYLALHILGSKIHENVQLSTQNKIVESIDGQLREFTCEVISLVSNILGCDLTKDERLFNGLVLHLRPAINRMTYGLNLRNPLINEIKSKYPAIFGATWATSTLFEKHYCIKVSEEEIGYIALHVGAALERVDTSTRAVIVCGSGIGTCELVAARLLRQVPNLTILGTFSMYDLKNLDKDSFDIVITTVPLDAGVGFNKPIVNISPLTTDEDISKIKRVLKNVEKAARVSGFSREELVSEKPKLFYENLIFLKEKSRCKNDIILKLSQSLIDKGFVKKEFSDTVIAREKLTSTSVGKQAAIPHGEESFVNNSCIAIATLEEPVEWGTEKVDIIFLLALRLEDKNYIKSFFSYFYSILSDDETLNKIRSSNSNDQVLAILSNYK